LRRIDDEVECDGDDEETKISSSSNKRLRASSCFEISLRDFRDSYREQTGIKATLREEELAMEEERLKMEKIKLERKEKQHELETQDRA
jgi:hypothetical protein